MAAGQYLFQGLANLGEAVDRKREQAKREGALAKAMGQMVKNSPELAGIVGDPQVFSNMSAEDQITVGRQALAQIELKQRADQIKQAMQEQALQTKAETDFETVMRRAVEPGAPGQTVPSAFGGPPLAELPAVPPRFDPQRLLLALAEAPGATRARGFGQMDSLIRAAQAGEGEPPVMPVPAKVGGRDLIVNPKSGAFTDVTAQPAPQIPPGMEAIGATEDENGRLQIRYGFPKAEGKALTQTEVQSIAALQQAEMDLNTLENIYKELGPDYGGPVSARVKSVVMGGQNPNIAALENAITAATPNLARGVFREVGVLTDQDVARYKQLLPAPTDTQEVRTRKIKQLRDRIAQGRKEIVTSLKAAGRDVQGFAKSDDAATRFDSEAAARSAGAKTGDVIELYDPGTATYRKARLK